VQPVAHRDHQVLLDDDLARHRASSRVDAPNRTDRGQPF